MNEPQDFEDGDDGPSKSELKRQDRGLQDLGVALVELPEAELDALDAAREPARRGGRLPAHHQPRRAGCASDMFIGKLLRKIDAEPIRAALARRSENDRQRVRSEHAIERWRDRLLADEPGAWTELAATRDRPPTCSRCARWPGRPAPSRRRRGRRPRPGSCSGGCATALEPADD